MENDNGIDAASLANIQKELAQINAHRFIRIYNSLPRLLGVNFLKGLAPIIGEWAAQIAQQMQAKP